MSCGGVTSWHLALGFYCISTTCTAPFGSQALDDMPKVTWDVSDCERNQNWFTCPRLLFCPSTTFCFKDGHMTRDRKETRSHLFIYTSVIQNILHTCVTWHSNATPCRRVLICREGVALSEYGAFIPWTYFLQDVRLCNPAELQGWLPLQKADSFSAVF